MVAPKHQFTLHTGAVVSLTTDEINEFREILGSNVFISNGYDDEPEDINEEQLFNAIMQAAIKQGHF